MMAAILNSTMLDSDTAMLDSDTFLSSLRFTQKQSPSTLNQTNSIWLTWWWLPSLILPSWIQPILHKTLTQNNSIWLKLIHSHHNLMAAILNSAILNLAILDLATLVFPLKLTHTCQDCFPPFAQKNLHSFILTQLDDGSHLEFYHVGFRHCHLGFRLLLIFSQIHSKTISLHYDSWLKLIQSDSNLFILTQLDDGSHLEFCHLEFGHLGFSHLSFSSQTHSHLPRLVPTICTIKPSLIHSDSTWWWQPSWILPCWIKKLHSFILTQLVDGSHLEFCHLGFRHLVFFSQIHSKALSLHSDSWLKLINLTQTYSFWLNLMMAAILNSTMLD